MENKYYVYEWFIVPTGEVFYVGKGCGDRYKTLGRRNRFFLDMYNTHECDVRIIEDQLYEDDAYNLEHSTVLWYRENTNFRLTNQTDGGDGTRGFRPTEEHKRKISAFFKEKWQDEGWRAAIISQRHNPDSTYQSEEFKQKISSLVTGEKNPNYGHHWTDEMKESLREKQKASGRYVDTNNPKHKQIQCVETQEKFTCIKFAQEKYGLKSPASFTVALDKPNRTAAGLHWISIPS